MSLFLTHGRRYTLRLDGFASINAPLRGGTVITKPLVFTGAELEINYSTSAAGRIQVELQDTAGTPIDGFTLAACDPIYGDHIARTVRWQGSSDLTNLSGSPVKIRFVMEDADLYCVKFNPPQNGIKPTSK